MNQYRCSDIRPLLSGYFDDELDPPERQRVEAHLQECPECRAVLADYGAIGRALRDLERPAPPASLRRTVRARTEPRPRAAVPFARLAQLAAMAAAIVALYTGAFALLRGTRDTEGTVAVERPTFHRGAPSQAEAISLHFNRPMDPESVEQNLHLAPTPAGPVSYSWSDDHQTLTIEPRSQLSPDTTYVVTIGQQARDNRGQSLNRPLVGEVKVAAEPAGTDPGTDKIALAQSFPTPPTSTAVPATVAAGTATPAPREAGPTTPSTPAPTVPPAATPAGAATAPAAAPASAVSSPGTSSPTPAASPTGARPAPTKPPATVAPTAVAAAPDPPITATPGPGEGAPMPAVAATATGVPTATPTVAAVPSVQPPEPVAPATCATAVHPAFEKPLAHDPTSPTWLGCPTEAGQLLALAEQWFDHGYALWRSDSGRFLVLLDTSTTWSAYALQKPERGAAEGPAALVADSVAAGFRTLLDENPELAARLGAARGSVRSYRGETQVFEKGAAYQTAEGGARFLLSGGTWRQMDRQGGLSQPTSAPVLAPPH